MAQKSFKRFVISLPVIGYAASVVSNVTKLPKLRKQVIEADTMNDRLLKELQKTQANFGKQVELNSAEHDDINKKFASLMQATDNLSQRFGAFESSQKSADTKQAKSKSSAEDDEALFADDHILDTFYINFEDHFRGSEEMITKRLEEYLPDFEDTKVNFKKTPVLDIGSGRGEFLQLLSNHRISAVGLDINHNMVERSVKKGLKAVQGDALTHLKDSKSQSYGAITGFHIVEHIPFNTLLRIFTNAYRCLAQDGFVLFETPNPENIIVGSAAFYTDPSHLNPIPPDLLAFALETCGFRDVEIRRLHPVDGKDVTGLPEEVAGRFYGPRDYAVIGYK